MWKKLLLFLLVLYLCAGCKNFYTQEDVNATTVAKIKEMAALQRINITVETVIVKEYVVVTATPGPTQFVPVPFSTMTPVGFARFSKEQVYKALAEGGLKIRQYFFELGEDEINGLAKQVTSATKFTVESSMDEHFGRLYIFAKEETLNDAKIYLQSALYPEHGNTVLSKENILIELDANTPAETVHAVQNILDTMH
jgi:hypothetical protein